MKRGYFDDFKDLKETQGRLFEPSAALSAPEASAHLPTLAVGALGPRLLRCSCAAPVTKALC
jgi:hypothetical protein